MSIKSVTCWVWAKVSGVAVLVLLLITWACVKSLLLITDLIDMVTRKR